jgi:hypothetical protein
LRSAAAVVLGLRGRRLGGLKLCSPRRRIAAVDAAVRRTALL